MIVHGVHVFHIGSFDNREAKMVSSGAIAFIEGLRLYDDGHTSIGFEAVAGCTLADLDEAVAALRRWLRFADDVREACEGGTASR
jgi:hypothetical protein